MSFFVATKYVDLLPNPADVGNECYAQVNRPALSIV